MNNIDFLQCCFIFNAERSYLNKYTNRINLNFRGAGAQSVIVNATGCGFKIDDLCNCIIPSTRTGTKTKARR